MRDVIDRLLEQARLRPASPAVVEDGRVFTYAEFLDKVRNFAAICAEHDQPRVLVAVGQGCAAYAAMFGALLAGGTYAPVNISSPEARLRHICAMFEPHIVVAAPAIAASFVGYSSIRIVDPDARASQPHDARSHPPVTHNPIAYVIFTSGSTGAPKGVAIPRTALAHYVDWLGPTMQIGPGDRMSQHPNIGFDLSVLDIYGALCFGAALYPFVGRTARLLPARKVREDALTIWNSVPSVVTLIQKSGELNDEHFRSVRLFTFCGEVLLHSQVAGLFAARPDAVVFNTYGPTEATVAMTCRRLTAETAPALYDPAAPLGEPIGDMGLDLIGGETEGELLISGPQVAAGYWRDEALTALKFGDIQTDSGPVRTFRTGDHAIRQGGELYFASRKDDMIKLRGHRIHLGEIREALGRLGWTSSFVFERDGALYAAIEGDGAQPFDEHGVLEQLAKTLDTYFIPRRLLYFERFPRNSNDKIDVAALKQTFEGANVTPQTRRLFAQG